MGSPRTRLHQSQKPNGILTELWPAVTAASTESAVVCSAVMPTTCVSRERILRRNSAARGAVGTLDSVLNSRGPRECSAPAVVSLRRSLHHSQKSNGILNGRRASAASSVQQWCDGDFGQCCEIPMTALHALDSPWENPRVDFSHCFILFSGPFSRVRRARASAPNGRGALT